MKLLFRLVSLLVIGLGWACSTSDGRVYDVVLANGRVMDPESGLDAVRNVGVRNGVIEKISRKSLLGHELIDASGLVVAPGFIDLHAHGQHFLAQQLQALDGVTSALEMELGAYPNKEYYSRRDGKALINYGATVSHICLRAKVKLDLTCPDLIDYVAKDPVAVATDDEIYSAEKEYAFFDTLTDAELTQLNELVIAELESGAPGIGFGIEYTPGASRKEIFDIFQIAADYRAPAFVHVRRRPLDGAQGVPLAVVQEVIANAAVTGAPLQIVHVASTGFSSTSTVVDMIAAAQERGLDITGEVYPYTAGSNSIGTNMLNEGWRERFEADYSDLEWVATGERLTEETFFKYRKEQPSGTINLHVIPEEAVNYAVAHPVISIASDGMPWVTNKEHPRGTGTFARVLGKYVREDGLLNLMTAIKKITLMPAQRMEEFAPAFARKGRIREGADADITIFDPDTVIDNATFQNPMRSSGGIPHVLVGGVFVVKHGLLVPNVFPGEGLKSRVVSAPTDEN
ncbi:MAG: amidohydrolase family protein [Pseudomonadota bacterium]